jgi:hypothetical protein
VALLLIADLNSSWNEKRIARQILVLAFLSAIVTINDTSQQVER